MKSFLVKPKFENGEFSFSFLDQEDTAAYQRLLASFARKPGSKIKITFDVFDEESMTEKQKSLFKVLVSKVAKASGNDKDEVKFALAEGFGRGPIESLSKKDFSDFMEWSTNFINAFFNFDVQLDKNGFIEINKT